MFFFSAKWKNFLLANDFALDPMLSIEATERHWGYHLISKLPVEEYAPLLESKARPLLQSLLRDKKVDMSLLKSSLWLLSLVAIIINQTWKALTG